MKTTSIALENSDAVHLPRFGQRYSTHLSGNKTSGMRLRAIVTVNRHRHCHRHRHRTASCTRSQPRTPKLTKKPIKKPNPPCPDQLTQWKSACATKSSDQTKTQKPRQEKHRVSSQQQTSAANPTLSISSEQRRGTRRTYKLKHDREMYSWPRPGEARRRSESIR